MGKTHFPVVFGKIDLLFISNLTAAPQTSLCLVQRPLLAEAAADISESIGGAKSRG